MRHGLGIISLLVYGAKTKTEVDCHCGHMHTRFTCGRTLTGDADSNAQAEWWLETTANVRIHRPRRGRLVARHPRHARRENRSVAAGTLCLPHRGAGRFRPEPETEELTTAPPVDRATLSSTATARTPAGALSFSSRFSGATCRFVRAPQQAYSWRSASIGSRAAAREAG